jgi:6,7-dimethyl-8-ribityllumazine synthase
MAGSGTPLPVAPIGEAKVLIVEARYHAAINDLLLEGASAVLAQAGATIEVVTVPGALEIPPAIAMAHATRRFDGYVALGCVIRGETTHYELVAGESARGITELGIRGRAPIGNGILTVENEAQAMERADPARQDKGGHAARAALALLAFGRRLGVA